MVGITTNSNLGGGGSSVPDGATVLPVNDVSTLLKCAGLRNAYTTIGEVLADRPCFFNMFASQNAVNYLVRCTAFITSICSNKDILNGMGLLPTRIVILLADLTWREAICASSYYKEALRTYIPVMTSNTTPYGTCFASSFWNSGFEAYRGVRSDSHWCSKTQSANQEYWGYRFIVPTRIFKVQYALTNSYYGMYKFDFQGSKDGTNYTTILTHTGPMSYAQQTFTLDSGDFYTYYRMLRANTESLWSTLESVSFYGVME